MGVKGFGEVSEAFSGGMKRTLLAAILPVASLQTSRRLDYIEWKRISMCTLTATALPSFLPGWKSHCLTASTAASSTSLARPLTTCVFFGVPRELTTVSIKTEPSIRMPREPGEYSGLTCLITRGGVMSSVSA